jgi:hypothetical protein
VMIESTVIRSLLLKPLAPMHVADANQEEKNRYSDKEKIEHSGKPLLSDLT